MNLIKSKYCYTLQDVEFKLPRKSWWALFIILPFAKRISLFIINYTDIKPNTITLLSFLLAIVAAIFFLKGSHPYLIIAAILFELNYLFDCVDGSVARVKNLESPFGAYIDWMCDRVRILILTLTLGYGQWKVNDNILPLVLSAIYLGLNNLIILSRAIQRRVLDSFLFQEQVGIELVKKNISYSKFRKIFSKWLKITYDKNIMPYYHDVETDAIVFFIGPLFNKIVPTLVLSIILAGILVIILNILFLISIVGREYEKKENNNKGCNTSGWRREKIQRRST
ncbi:MAG TPA: CDP-alcohol phosphatidyltransferase family protein [Candidatus Desulfofervidus auxilii]|uniref:CDP-alcohol phosphatidyltransferase family protein n=1 Tax=Desulfofervidus auxilii TaxID=1621989 RepID=A0A7C0YA54_DESA2|nr:CDP-alcohol phosphatidyltransferase family protein [Candidatus Desulfofervidus auxilii]